MISILKENYLYPFVPSTLFNPSNIPSKDDSKFQKSMLQIIFAVLILPSVRF